MIKKKIIYLVLIIWVFVIGIGAKKDSNMDLIYRGDSHKPYIYLTFDDGYTVRNTTKILDILLEENVPATFFVEGDFLKNNIALARRIHNEQILANHTMSHKDITKMSEERLRKEILTFEEESKKITGHINTKYFRPPMGKINKKQYDILEELGYTVFMWNVQYYDYVHLDDYGSEYVLKQIMKQVENGSIILMHTLTNSNADSLKTIIHTLQDKGFIFSSLENLVS